jgi:hypothetical protein
VYIFAIAEEVAVGLYKVAMPLPETEENHDDLREDGLLVVPAG